MAKLFVICGHGAGDPGCCAGGYTEAERVRALGQRIKDLGAAEVELGDMSRNWYADGGINRLNTDAPVVELHMDASGIGTAHGAHVIIKSGFEPDDYDKALGDREKFNSNIDKLARIYLECFGITASSAPTPSTQAQPAPQETTEDFGGKYRCTVSALNVRDAPSLGGNVVASYSGGQTVVLDDWYKIADGYVWGRYTSYSGNVRYVAVGRATGKPEADDYLIKE